MAEARTLNLKGIDGEEREDQLFTALEQLRTGESLEVILEYNPLGLVYTLKTGGEFGVAYLSQGSEEWVLELTRKAQPADKKEQLKELLRMLKVAKLSPEGKGQARELLKVLDAATLGLLEKELAREGIMQEEIRTHLRDIHLEVLRDSLAARPIEVSNPHPVHTLMEEHKVMLDNLNDLSYLMQRLQARRSFGQAGPELAELAEVARRLLAAESHHQREEQVIFPRLERHGIREPLAIMKADHEEFRRRTQRLQQLAERSGEARGLAFEEWRREVVELGGYLSRELASHILKEDNILYQTALQVFSPRDWEEAKSESDRIGYQRGPGERVVARKP